MDGLIIACGILGFLAIACYASYKHAIIHNEHEKWCIQNVDSYDKYIRVTDAYEKRS